MAILSNVAARHQLVPLQFTQADVAASQTDAQLSVAAVDNAADDQLACTEYAMPWPGQVVGVSYALSTAGTAGTLTVGASIGGTEDADTTQTVTTAASGYGRVPRAAARFVAGDLIGCEITTDGSWNGTSSDLIVTVWVLLRLEGI